jgi:hypothetical protein
MFKWLKKREHLYVEPYQDRSGKWRVRMRDADGNGIFNMAGSSFNTRVDARERAHRITTAKLELRVE